MPSAQSVQGTDGCEVHMKFLTIEEAKRCKYVKDGQQFDGNQMKVLFVLESDNQWPKASE